MRFQIIVQQQGTAMEPSSPWLTVARAAEYASVSCDTIYDACLRNELQHARVGGRQAIRLKAEWVDAWLLRYVHDVEPAAAQAAGRNLMRGWLEEEDGQS